MNDEQLIWEAYKKLINESIFDDSSYPNVDNKFYKVIHLDIISDIPQEEIHEWEKKISNLLFSYTNKNHPELVKNIFDKYPNESEDGIIQRYFKDMEALGTWYYQKYPKIVEDIDKNYKNLTHALPSPEDAEEVENYPLFVSLYDTVKAEYELAWGGEEYTDSHGLLLSKQITNPTQRENTAKWLWNEANKHQDPFRGKAMIVLEKVKGGWGEISSNEPF